MIALIVDDNSDHVLLFRKLLKQRGYKCKSCAVRSEAVRLMREAYFDLVIWDCNLPNGDYSDFQIVQNLFPYHFVGVSAFPKGDDVISKEDWDAIEAAVKPAGV